MNDHMSGWHRKEIEQVIESYFSMNGRSIIESMLRPIIEEFLSANLGDYVSQHLETSVLYNLTLRDDITRKVTTVAMEMTRDALQKGVSDALKKAGFKIR